jgi:hypothetical protein
MNSFKRIALRTSLVALLAAALGTCLPMNASADDIAGSFSAASNPNGAWSYGSLLESGPTFTLFQFNNNGVFTGAGCPVLPNWSGATNGFPVVVANNTGSPESCITWTLPTDTLNMHPANIPGLDSDVRWTAPASGTYLIKGSYSALDSTTTHDSILVNGISAFSTDINYQLNKSTTFSLTETLTAGDTIDFAVNCCSGADQSFNNDSTGLQGTITASAVATPEPATLALLGTGLAAISLLRRKGKSGLSFPRVMRFLLPALVIICWLAVGGVGARADSLQLGVFSFDPLIPGLIDAFSVNNSTGAFSIPGFDVLDNVTFKGATLDLNGAPGPSLGDLTPGISQFAVLDSDVYSMAAFQAVLSTTLFTLSDGTHFQADSNTVRTTISPSFGGYLTPGVDFAPIKISGSFVITSVPEPPSWWLFVGVAPWIILLRRPIVRHN